MKTIWFGNEKFEKMVANAGIDLICNEHMEITIADEDVAKVAEILGDDNSMYWGVDEDEQETKKHTYCVVVMARRYASVTRWRMYVRSSSTLLHHMPGWTRRLMIIPIRMLTTSLMIM